MTKGKADVGLKYLGIRDGEKWWEARLTWTDQRTGRKRSTKATYAAPNTHQAAVERKRRLAEKRGATGATKERHRFNDAIDEYLATITTHSTRLSRTSNAKTVRAAFGEWWADKIAPDHLQDWLDALDAAVPTKKSYRALLSLSFKRAVKRRWTLTNPAKGLTITDSRKSAMANRRPPKRALSLADASRYIDDVRANEPPEMYLLLLAQLVLGCRFAEVTAMTWDQVDFETGMVVLDRGQYRGVIGGTKARKDRDGAFDAALCIELLDHRRVMAEHKWPDWESLVFPRPLSARKRHSSHISHSTAYAAVKRSFKRLGIEMNVATHVARHTMVSAALQARESAALLRKMLGHSDDSQQLTYTSLEAKQVRALAERVGAALRSGTVSGTEGQRTELSVRNHDASDTE